MPSLRLYLLRHPEARAYLRRRMQPQPQRPGMIALAARMESSSKNPRIPQRPGQALNLRLRALRLRLLRFLLLLRQFVRRVGKRTWRQNGLD